MNHKRKRLFFVGGEDVSLRIPMVKMLNELGYEVTVVGSEPRHIFDQANIRYFEYSLDRGFTPLLDVKAVYQLFRFFREKRPEIVHTFDTKPNILACIASWFAREPKTIRTINGMGDIFSSESLRNAILSRIYNLSQYLASGLSQYTIFQNIDDMKYFTSRGLVSTKKARYVAGSGVCVEAFEKSVGSEDYLAALKDDLNIFGRCTIILISRIIKAKGIIEYLETARALSSHSKRLRFLLVGNIEAGVDALHKSTIDEYSDVCRYLGRRDDVSSLIAISDIVVLPSYYKEGVPRALIEGASLRKPLISSSVSGCRDIVIDKHNGLLVPPQDVKKLMEAILYLSHSPKICLEMGNKGRQLVEDKFSLKKVCEGWRALY